MNLKIFFKELEKLEKELESDIEEIEQKTPISKKAKKLKNNSQRNALSPSLSR